MKFQGRFGRPPVRVRRHAHVSPSKVAVVCALQLAASNQRVVFCPTRSPARSRRLPTSTALGREAIQMRRNQLDVKRSRLWVARLKGSLSVEHPIAGDELRAIKRYLATREDNLPWLFVSERQAQLTRQAVNYIVRVAGEKAKLGRVWPHMLRHSCGYYLADQGTDLRTMQDYLGHRDPKHTAHYTRVAGHRFEGLWK